MMSNEKAVAAGLTFRPHDQTLRDALEHGAESDALGLPESMELSLLAAVQDAAATRAKL
jgi:hypothetical protein